jgi:hypothetical protein
MHSSALLQQTRQSVSLHQNNTAWKLNFYLTSWCPCCAAHSSGVAPCSSYTSVLLPAANIAATCSTAPLRAATCSAYLLMLLLLLMGLVGSPIAASAAACCSSCSSMGCVSSEVLAAELVVDMVVACNLQVQHTTVQGGDLMQSGWVRLVALRRHRGAAMSN